MFLLVPSQFPLCCCGTDTQRSRARRRERWQWDYPVTLPLKYTEAVSTVFCQVRNPVPQVTEPARFSQEASKIRFWVCFPDMILV